MSLQSLIPIISEDIKQNKDILKINKDLFEIYEGDLSSKLEEKIRAEFSNDTVQDVTTRAAPINIELRLVQKMSQSYTKGPTRTVMNGTESDQVLLDWYVDKMDMNNIMNSSNEMFNFSNSSLLYPFVSGGLPNLRVIPSHQFWVYSQDKVLQKPTHIVTFAEDSTSILDTKEMVDKLFAYSSDEFLVTDHRGNIDREHMTSLMNPGINPFGQLPFVYINKSKFKLVPVPDIDMLKMSLIIPMLMTDLFYAVKYQSFSTTYGIDLDFGNLRKAPNAFWDFQSKNPGEGNPQVGTIKPEVDIGQVLELIKSALSLWFTTKGISVSGIDSLSSSNFASGLSKIIDEMDVVDIIRKQSAIYRRAEIELWNLVLKVMHPIWVRSGQIDQSTMFSPRATVDVSFPDIAPTFKRSDLIKEVKEEMEAGFTTKERAIKRLNPDMTDDEVFILMKEISEERTIFPSPFIEDSEDMEEEL